MTSPYRAVPSACGPGLCPSVKVLVTGGYAAGKTTFVRAVSQLPPVCTDVPLTGAPTTTPDTAGKAQTTAAMDFGRTTIGDSLMVYLFASPGHARFWPIIDSLTTGVAAALVLVDTGRLDGSFPILDHLDARRLPYLVAVNRRPSVVVPGLHQVRHALQVPVWVPVLSCDAGEPRSAVAVLTHLIGQTLAGRLRPTLAGTPSAPAHIAPSKADTAPLFPPATAVAGPLTPIFGGVL